MWFGFLRWFDIHVVLDGLLRPGLFLQWIEIEAKLLAREF